MLHFAFSPTAKRDILLLDLTIRKRIYKKLKRLEHDENILSHLKKLTDHSLAEYRLRIGDYRLLIDRSSDTLLALCVRHRRESYR
jgi:mRNA interferase RelE/StbE